MQVLSTTYISIHALRKESDFSFTRRTLREQISIHALRKESDHDMWVIGEKRVISIHALRKESDMLNIALSRFKWLFQSTLSVRRAT